MRRKTLTKPDKKVVKNLNVLIGFSIIVLAIIKCLFFDISWLWVFFPFWVWFPIGWLGMIILSIDFGWEEVYEKLIKDE